MEADNLLLVVAVIAVAVALVNTVVTFNVIGPLKEITGLASSDDGYANVTVEENVAINFTNDTIDWGSGYLEANKNSATLDSNGTVVNGTWGSVDHGLTLQNIGTVNATLNVSAGSDADGFIGGSEVTPGYKWKFTNKDAGACVNIQDTSYTSVTTSPSVKTICDPLQYYSDKDELYIDIELVIPTDSNKGALSDTITAEATADTT